MYIVMGKDIEGEIKANGIILRVLPLVYSTKIDNYESQLLHSGVIYGVYLIRECFDIFPSFRLVLTYGLDKIEYKIEEISEGMENGGDIEKRRFEYMIRYGIDIDRYEEIGYGEFVKKLIEKKLFDNKRRNKISSEG